MQIKKISIEKLSNDPANARKHDDRNIEAIVGSLRRFGQQKPIVVDVSGVVRAGNGTGYAWQRKKFGKVLLATEALHEAKRMGATPIVGYQLRYIYFLDPTARQRLTVPILPFSEIDRRGAGMYLGKPRVRSVDSDTSTVQVEESGANPTRTL